MPPTSIASTVQLSLTIRKAGEVVPDEVIETGTLSETPAARATMRPVADVVSRVTDHRDGIARRPVGRVVDAVAVHQKSQVDVLAGSHVLPRAGRVEAVAEGETVEVHASHNLDAGVRGGGKRADGSDQQGQESAQAHGHSSRVQGVWFRQERRPAFPPAVVRMSRRCPRPSSRRSRRPGSRRCPAR